MVKRYRNGPADPHAWFKSVAKGHSLWVLIDIRGIMESVQFAQQTLKVSVEFTQWLEYSNSKCFSRGSTSLGLRSWKKFWKMGQNSNRNCCKWSRCVQVSDLRSLFFAPVNYNSSPHKPNPARAHLLPVSSFQCLFSRHVHKTALRNRQLFRRRKKRCLC